MAKSKRNDTYWKERFGQLEDEQYQRSATYYQDLQKQFRMAQNDIQMDIERWYQRLADNNDISYAAARKLLKRDELDEFHWSVEKYIEMGNDNAVDQRWMKQLENASAKVHISKLEAMKISIQQHAELLYTRYEGGVTDFLRESYRNTYYHTAYEIVKGTGVGVNLHVVDRRRVDTILGKPWAADGANFSSRIWKDKEKLVKTLHVELSQNIIRGADPRQAIDSIAQIMGVSKRQAESLVMTEAAAISSAASRECYKELGLERYQILATLDNRTSEICREMDGQIFNLPEYEVGVTAPPFHPRCRTTTAPYFDDEFAEGELRVARDRKTGETYYVPADIRYETWSREYIQEGLSAGDKVINGIPEHNKPKRLGKVDFSDKNMVLSKLMKYENVIADSMIENAVVISKDGIIRQCFGNVNGVYPDSDIGDKLTGACVTHNHPVGSANEYSFSKRDITLFMDNSLEVLRGIDEKYIYELTRNQEEIDEPSSSIFEINEYSFRHEEVIREAKRLGIGYRRYQRE